MKSDARRVGHSYSFHTNIQTSQMQGLVWHQRVQALASLGEHQDDTTFYRVYLFLYVWRNMAVL